MSLMPDTPPNEMLEKTRGKTLPIEPKYQPLVLLELIQRLKVRDVMTANIFTLARVDPIRKAKDLMRDKHISGVPIVENGRLFGIISIVDIIRAMEGGYADAPCGDHMTSKLVVLEDDMPLSFAVQYFDRYHFGRFPVLNHKRMMVGILCQRDINRALVVELSAEVSRLEESYMSSATPVSGAEEGTAVHEKQFEFPVVKFDLENAGKAANAIKAEMVERGFPPKIVRRVAVAAYELEINLCIHSDGGVLIWRIGKSQSEIIARDTGPGIADVEWVCRDGTSTANDWIRSLGFGAGLGLVNVKRVSDHFEIESKLGKGTTVQSIVKLDPPPPAANPQETTP